MSKNTYRLSDFDTVNTKKFEKQIKKVHTNGERIICGGVKEILAHPLFKKTYYPSALKGYDYIKINGIKYYFIKYYFLHDLVHSSLLQLYPMDLKEAQKKIKDQIANSIKEL